MTKTAAGPMGSPLNRQDKVAAIRLLNDNFRTSFLGGRILLTQGVGELPPDTKARVLLAVQSFNDFDKDDDPYGEHDFGSFEVDGGTFFFKIDYYDATSELGSESPEDPKATTRVMTIMRAEEY
jgi:hypothetical protein